MRRTWKPVYVYYLKYKKNVSNQGFKYFKKKFVLPSKFYLFFNRHMLKEPLKQSDE